MAKISGAPKKGISKPGLYAATAGGVVVLAIICIVGYRAVTKPKPVPAPVKPAPQTTVTPAVTPAKSNYDGNYQGISGVAQGLTNVSANVAGTGLSGTAVYAGPYNTKVNVTISGKADDKGAVSGTFSGSGTVMGQSIAVSGSFTGKITNNVMAVNYKGSASGQSVSSSITLTKK